MAGISGVKQPLSSELCLQLEDIGNKVSNVKESLSDLEDNNKRWLLVGIGLHTVITPALRKFVAPKFDKLWQDLKRTNNIDVQLYPNHVKDYRSTFFNYEAINNNKALGLRQQANFDYQVKNSIDLSKLFLQTDMAQYNGFNESCDLSVLLGIISKAGICPSSAILYAEKVRSEIRNCWVHCNYSVWDETKYKDSFDLMVDLVRNLGLSIEEENDIRTELEKWNQNESFSDLEDNIKRWLLVGIGLHTVISPALRKFVAPKFDMLWQHLKRTNNIDVQLYPNHMKACRSTFFNYEAINNNKALGLRQQANFDYQVKNSIDLSKLFLQTNMAQYNGFNESCDLLALLGIISKAGICPSSAILYAEKVRSEIRNYWVRCNYSVWDETKYKDSFDLMVDLVRNLGLSIEEENDIRTELEKWNQNVERRKI